MMYKEECLVKFLRLIGNQTSKQVIGISYIAELNNNHRDGICGGA